MVHGCSWESVRTSGKLGAASSFGCPGLDSEPQHGASRRRNVGLKATVSDRLKEWRSIGAVPKSFLALCRPMPLALSTERRPCNLRYRPGQPRDRIPSSELARLLGAAVMDRSRCSNSQGGGHHAYGQIEIRRAFTNGRLPRGIIPGNIVCINGSGIRLRTANITQYPVPTANSAPTGIAVGPDGALWFTENTGNKIGRITTAGAITEYAVPTSNGQPTGITAGPEQSLWFTETTGNKIGKITLTGEIREFRIPTKNSSPVGIALGNGWRALVCGIRWPPDRANDRAGYFY